MAVNKKRDVAQSREIVGPLLLKRLDTVAAVEQDHRRKRTLALRRDQQAPQGRRGFPFYRRSLSFGLRQSQWCRWVDGTRELDPFARGHGTARHHQTDDQGCEEGDSHWCAPDSTTHKKSPEMVPDRKLGGNGVVKGPRAMVLE